jgi:hypothetical protein
MREKLRVRAVPLRGLFVCAFFAFCLAFPVGCTSSGPPLHPVEGKATLDGKPMSGGTVSLFVEGQQGNVSPSGEIRSDGTYTISTNGKPGAPLGKYKVVLAPALPTGGDPAQMKQPGAFKPMTIQSLPPKYLDQRSTPLVIEVVANPSPGAYDLKLTSR